MIVNDIDSVYRQVTGKEVTHQQRSYFLSMMGLLGTDDPSDPAMVLLYMAARNEADFAKSVDNLRTVLETSKINFDTVYAQKTDELFNKFEQKVDAFKTDIKTLNESQSIQRVQAFAAQLNQYQNNVAQINQDMYQRNANQMIADFQQSMNHVQQAVNILNQHHQNQKAIKITTLILCVLGILGLIYFFGMKYLLVTGMHIADGYRGSQLPYKELVPLVSKSVEGAVIKLFLLVTGWILTVILWPKKQLINDTLQYSLYRVTFFAITGITTLFVSYKILVIVKEAQLV